MSEEGKQYMVMEYVNQGSVDEYLRTNQSKLPAFVLYSIAKDAGIESYQIQKVIIFLYKFLLAAGMLYLSIKNIVHCDLACRNLLITSGHQVKISDFGLSNLGDTNFHQTRMKVVPVKWSAPEVLKSHNFSVLSDVWSFGGNAYWNYFMSYR